MKVVLVVSIALGLASACWAESSDTAVDKLLQENSTADSELAPKNKTKVIADPEEAQIDSSVDKYLENQDGHKLYRDEPEQKNGKKDMTAALRTPAIKETALAFGAQAGLHWRYAQINELIESKWRGRLDQASFRPFILDGRILMPSILIMKDDENYLSDTKLVESNISFKVAEEAKIVSVAPTYRNYLIRYFEPPKPVNSILKPGTDAENKIWRKALKDGFITGVRMADEIFNDGLLKMERDIRGRVNYSKMISLKMISPAALKVTERGVTFNGRTMNVGETIYEITDNASYKSMDEWRTAWLNSKSPSQDELTKGEHPHE